MGRISDKVLYPLDTVVSKDDYVVGSDFDQGLRTVNFNLGSIIRLINAELNFSSAEYRFSDGTDPDISANTEGFFLVDSGTNQPADTQKIYINKKAAGALDLTDLFVLLASNTHTFSLKLINSSDPSDAYYFKVNTAVAAGDHYELDVDVVGVNYQKSFGDLTTYNLYLDVMSGEYDNINVVKTVNVTGPITAAKAATAINATVPFVISDDESVYYNVVSDNGTSAAFIPVGIGKGEYGTGKTQLDASQLSQLVAGSGAGGPVVLKKLTIATYSKANVVAGINALTKFYYGGGGIFFYVTVGSSVYVLMGTGLAAGEYGTGGSPVVTANLELFSIMATTNIINVVKPVALPGEFSDSAVVTAINELPQIQNAPGQNLYFKVTPNGSTTTYLFILKGIGAATLGQGGTQVTATDLELVSVTSGGTSWKLAIEGQVEEEIEVGKTVNFIKGGYAIVQYTEAGEVLISTSQELSDLLATFKPTVVLSKAQYQTLKDNNQLNPNTIYAKTCVE